MAYTGTASLVSDHLINRSGIKQAADGQRQFTEVRRITGCAGTNALADATNAAGLPNYGDQSTFVPGYYLLERNLVPMDNSRTEVRAELVYQWIPTVECVSVSINANTQMMPCQFDNTGALLWVGFNNTGGTTPSSVSLGGGPLEMKDYINKTHSYNYSEIQKYVPLMSIEYTIFSNHILDDLWTYRGYVNADGWNQGNAGEWLLADVNTRINGNLVGSGTNTINIAQALYINTVRFLYSEAPHFIDGTNRSQLVGGPGWRPLLYFKAQQTGITPTGINPKLDGWPEQSYGNGWRYPTIYPSYGFTNFTYIPQVGVDLPGHS